MQEVTLMIWDIMGEQGFRRLLQESYFFGAQGIIGLWDVTRKSTLPALYGWMKIAQGVTGEVPVVFLGNKIDLLNGNEMDTNSIKSLESAYENSGSLVSSAKTGQNVELAFQTLSEMIIQEFKGTPDISET
jgi:GTPase SAR1 family protein